MKLAYIVHKSLCAPPSDPRRLLHWNQWSYAEDHNVCAPSTQRRVPFLRWTPDAPATQANGLQVTA